MFNLTHKDMQMKTVMYHFLLSSWQFWQYNHTSADNGVGSKHPHTLLVGLYITAKIFRKT